MSAFTNKILSRLRSPDLIIVLLIFILSFIPRILLLSKGPFHYDTVDFLMQMRDRSISEHGMYMPIPSLIVIMLSYLRNRFLPGISDFQTLFIITVFLSSIAPVVTYLLFKKIFDKTYAFIYSLIVSFLPAFFLVSTFGRLDHALSLILLPVSIYYCLKKEWFLCSLFTGLLISCRGEGILILPCFLMFIFFLHLENNDSSFKDKILQAIKILFFLSFFAVGFWVLISLIINKERWIHYVIYNEIVKRFLVKQASDSLVPWSLDIKNMVNGTSSIIKLMILPVIFAIYGFYKKTKHGDFKEILLFIVSFVAPFIYVVNREADVPRYLIVPLFFLIYFSVHGICSVFKKLKFRIIFTFLCVATMFISVISLAYGRHMDAYEVDFVKYLESVIGPGGLVITQDEWIFIKYYTKLDVLIPPSGCNKKKWNEFFERIVRLLRSGRVLYLTSTGLTYDPCLIFRDYMNKNFYYQPIGERPVENWHGYCLIKRHVFNEQVWGVIPKKIIFNKFEIKKAL